MVKLRFAAVASCDRELLSVAGRRLILFFVFVAKLSFCAADTEWCEVLGKGLFSIADNEQCVVVVAKI